MPYGCYDTVSGVFVSADAGTSVFANILQPFNDPAGLVCFNPQTRWSFLGLLLALQTLLVIWFGMILRIAYGVISNKGAQDLRSEDEEEGRKSRRLSMLSSTTSPSSEWVWLKSSLFGRLKSKSLATRSLVSLALIVLDRRLCAVETRRGVRRPGRVRLVSQDVEIIRSCWAGLAVISRRSSLYLRKSER